MRTPTNQANNIKNNAGFAPAPADPHKKANFEEPNNRQQIETETRRLTSLGYRGKLIRQTCIENMAWRWSMFKDEVIDVFNGEKL